MRELGLVAAILLGLIATRNAGDLSTLAMLGYALTALPGLVVLSICDGAP